MPKTLILFVHGLAGGRGSWGNFETLIKEDAELGLKVDVDFFTYPTGSFRFWWSDKYVAPQEIADGLTSAINNKYVGYEKILLVCHSMGGLIGKRCIIDRLLRKHEIRISGIIFFATPHRGAELAAVAAALSGEHKQALAIKPDTKFLEVLNNEWLERMCEAQVDTTYVSAAQDSIVSKESAEGPRTSRREVDLGKGHINIVKPTSSDDFAFLFVKAAAKRVIYDKNADYAALQSAISEGDSHTAELLVATRGRSWIERPDADRAIEILERVVQRFDPSSAEVIWSRYLLVIARLFRARDTSSTAIDDELLSESERIRLAPVLLAEKMELARKRGDREIALKLYGEVWAKLESRERPRSAGEAYAVGTSHFLIANLLRYGGLYADARHSIEVAQGHFLPTIISHQTELAHCHYALEVCRSVTGVTRDESIPPGSSEFRPFAEALIVLAQSHAQWAQARTTEAVENAELAAKAFEMIGYHPYAARAKRLFDLLEVWRRLELGVAPERAVAASNSDGSILRSLLGLAGTSGTIHDSFSRLRPSQALGLLQFASTYNPNWTNNIGEFELPPLLQRSAGQLNWVSLRASSLEDANRILRRTLQISTHVPIPLIAD